jgi:hypothetical protein
MKRKHIAHGWRQITAEKEEDPFAAMDADVDAALEGTPESAPPAEDIFADLDKKAA